MQVFYAYSEVIFYCPISYYIDTFRLDTSNRRVFYIHEDRETTYERRINGIGRWSISNLPACGPDEAYNLMCTCLFGFAQGGFTMPKMLPFSRCALTAPFHPCLLRGGIFSAALSLGSRPPAINWHLSSAVPGLSSDKITSDCLDHLRIQYNKNNAKTKALSSYQFYTKNNKIYEEKH